MITVLIPKDSAVILDTLSSLLKAQFHFEVIGTARNDLKIVDDEASLRLKRGIEMEKIRVLIVDDSSVMRDGLQCVLRTCPDIEVLGQAANGLEAIAEAEQLKPDVILMDAQMPEMDGVEATRHIKERLPNIKILFLSVFMTHLEEALAAGADGYLIKDCDTQELVQAIRKLGQQE